MNCTKKVNERSEGKKYLSGHTELVCPLCYISIKIYAYLPNNLNMLLTIYDN
jgi:hypothetical protein